MNKKISEQGNRDLPNVPCSAEHSAECSLIFGQFGVPLFKGGRGKVKRKVYFLQFLEFFFNFRPFSDSKSFKIVAIRSTDALFGRSFSDASIVLDYSTLVRN